MQIAAAPAATRRGASRLPASSPARTPLRIFTVTGAAPATASTTASTQAAASSGAAEQGRPRAGLHHLAHRAGHVQVDEVGARGETGASRARQRRRLGGEELKADRALIGFAGEIGQGVAVVVDDPLGGDHLGEHEAGPEAAHGPPKGGPADTGHGRHEQPPVEAQGADRERLQQPLTQVVRGSVHTWAEPPAAASAGLLAAQDELDAAQRE